MAGVSASSGWAGRIKRPTHAFPNNIDTHMHALSLRFVWRSFRRAHKARKVNPAMAAGVAGTLRDMERIVGLADARAAPKPGRRRRRKKDIPN